MATELPPVDENVRVPDSVKRAAAAADARHAQVYGTPEPTDYKKAPAGGDDDRPINIVDTTPAPLPRVSTPGGDKIILPKTQVPPQPTTVAPPQPATVAPPQATTNQPPPQTPPQTPVLKLTPRDGSPAEPAADENDPSIWKQRFLSSQGRLEQAHRNLGLVQEQLAQMGDEVSRLHQQVQRPAQPEPVQPAQINFDPKDREALGDDFLAAMARVAAATAQATLQPTVQEIRKAQQQTAETMNRQMQATSMRYVHSQLDAAVPAWRDINKSMEFAQWLSLPDLYSGLPKGNLLRQAFANGDATRVVAFFKGFVADATSQAVTAVPQPSGHQPAVSLLSLAAPGPVKPATGTDVQLPPEKPIYTRAQIRQFYDEVRRGLWANRPQDKAAIEADMTAAPLEGRVVG